MLTNVKSVPRGSRPRDVAEVSLLVQPERVPAIGKALSITDIACSMAIVHSRLTTSALIAWLKPLHQISLQGLRKR